MSPEERERELAKSRHPSSGQLLRVLHGYVPNRRERLWHRLSKPVGKLGDLFFRAELWMCMK